MDRALVSPQGLLVLAALAASGCCNDAGACPDNSVAVRVSAGEASVDGVVVEGGPSDWTCEDLGFETVCRPETIPDGTYPLTVTAPGFGPQRVELVVRTYEVPPFSCDCEVPTGQVTIAFDAMAGPTPDAGVAGDAG